MSDTNPKSADVVIAVMGDTGTGKSTFIKHATGGERAVIGHQTKSETFNVETFSHVDPSSGASVMLVDTPGFDDSGEGVSDVDILEKIATFLGENGGRKLNGILYMYRITNAHMSRLTGKNIEVFKALCGEDRLSNVRIVSTNWDRVGFEEGNALEAGLAGPNGPFVDLVAGGARMARHDNEETSARSIISDLIPKSPILLKITEEMSDGRTLAETSAGSIIAEEIATLQRTHEAEMASLEQEMKEAAAQKNEKLKAELVAEQKSLEEEMMRAADDNWRLQETRMKKFGAMLGQEEHIKTQEKELFAKRPEERNPWLDIEQKWREEAERERLRQKRPTPAEEREEDWRRKEYEEHEKRRQQREAEWKLRMEAFECEQRRLREIVKEQAVKCRIANENLQRSYAQLDLERLPEWKRKLFKEFRRMSERTRTERLVEEWWQRLDEQREMDRKRVEEYERLVRQEKEHEQERKRKERQRERKDGESGREREGMERMESEHKRDPDGLRDTGSRETIRASRAQAEGKPV